jgi:hypothetical protein
MATQKHHCHWPDCTKAVPPAMWGCSAHWFALPAALRARVWATYRAGQEITKTPSPEYINVAREVQEWIANRVKEIKNAKKNQTPELPFLR